MGYKSNVLKATRIKEAVDFPNVVARGEPVGVEAAMGNGQGLVDYLALQGYNVQEGRGENSGLHIIVVGDDGMTGAADSRRHGTVDKISP